MSRTTFNLVGNSVGNPVGNSVGGREARGRASAAWILPTLLAALAPAAVASAQGGTAKKAGKGKAASSEARAANTTPPDELKKLIADLRAAHKPRPVHSFRGEFALTPTNPTANSTQVVIDLRFRVDKQRIRYKVEEGGKRFQRGRDARGLWVNIDDKRGPESLTTRENEGDIEPLKKHIRLARQLIRFLDPATLIGSLDNPRLGQKVFRGVPRAGKKVDVPCRTVTGTADKFPLYMAGGDRTKARVVLWVDDTDHLLAVEAYPIDARGRPSRSGEFIFMPTRGAFDGMALPTRLLFYRQEGSKRVPEAKVVVRSFEPNAALPDSKFDRNAAW